jgi:thiol-disulfide isomerase/thioredoxin
LGALLAVLVGLGGCGAAAHGEGGRHPDYAKSLAGSPAPLAALHAQGSELLEGGTDAFEARLAALHGYPVVVNVWASWCGPCQEELPTLQKLSARYGKSVAFLGVDSEDEDASAKTLMREDPLPYPSYLDHDKAIAESIGIPRGYPDLAFYGRDGELCSLRQGPYANQTELREAVSEFALHERCESG